MRRRAFITLLAGFVKSGDDYVRVSTNVPGSVLGRAQGTILDPRGAPPF